MYALIESLGVTFAIYALLAYSFAIPVSAGLLYAGQMGSMALAAYATALGVAAGYPVPLVAAGAIACVLVLTALLSRPALRLGELSMAIVTLGISQVIVTIASNLEITGGSLGLRGIPVVIHLPSALVVFALVIAVFLFARKRGILRMVRLVKEDPRVAESCGIDAHAVRFWALMAGALLSAVAGVLYAGYLTYLSPSVFSFQTLLQIVAFALVGGVSSIVGPIVGTALLWLAPQFLPMIGDWRFVAYGVLIIACVLWKPDGLMGRRAQRMPGGRRPAAPAAAAGPSRLSKRTTGANP